MIGRKRDDTPKVFDVRRTKISPPSTSRPLIVGHHPVMPDPMLQPKASPPEEPSLPQPEAEEPKPVIEPSQLQPVPAELLVAEPSTQPQVVTTDPQDLKVKLPAGQAAHSSSRMVWLIFVVAAIAAAAIIYFLLAG